VETNQQANDTHRKHSVQKDWFDEESRENYFSLCEGEADFNVETGQQDGCSTAKVKELCRLVGFVSTKHWSQKSAKVLRFFNQSIK
jgi:hypothetical protein